MNHFSTEEHVLYQILNAERKSYPFPHFFVKNVFPEPFYTRLTNMLDEKTDYAGVEGRYAGRTFGSLDGLECVEFMKSRRFLDSVLAMFGKELHKRYDGKKAAVYTDLRLVRDGIGYQIGPHTDAQWKLISLLFYLPNTSKYDQYGTSIYVPKEPDFRCPGGPHHAFDKFHRVATMPFIRNAAFCFLKTDNSFHGVEPVTVQFNRDVLLFNVYDEDIYLQHHKKPVVTPANNMESEGEPL